MRSPSGASGLDDDALREDAPERGAVARDEVGLRGLTFGLEESRDEE